MDQLTNEQVHSQIQLLHGADRALLDALPIQIFASHRARLGDVVLDFHIIGHSHLVRAADNSFFELFSSTPLALPVEHTSVPLRHGHRAQHEYIADGIVVSTSIRMDCLRNFAGFSLQPRLQYQFAAAAITAIGIEGCGYRTWHTYPESNLVVETETIVS